LASTHPVIETVHEGYSPTLAERLPLLRFQPLGNVEQPIGVPDAEPKPEGGHAASEKDSSRASTCSSASLVAGHCGAKGFRIYLALAPRVEADPNEGTASPERQGMWKETVPTHRSIEQNESTAKVLRNSQR
jgi:hypothetical protein